MIGALVIVSLGVCIAVYDAYHMRIPVVWNYALVAISTLYVLVGPVEDIPTAFIGACCVAGLFLITYLASRGRVLGFGDVILAISIGLLLGPIDGFFAVWLACVIGSLFGVYELARGTVRAHGKGIIGHQIPFGPFLVAGFLIVFLGYLSFGMLVDIHV
jgi:prepilin signal peptidase PulO-like enzyme (type II secretory pathway)